MNVAVLPAVFLAGFGVINNPVLGLAKRLHERAMPYTPHLIGLSENRTVLFPFCWIEHIPGVVVQHAETIIGRPTAAGGIDDEQVAVTAEHLRAFANRHG